MSQSLMKTKADILRKKGSTFPKELISLDDIIISVKEGDKEGKSGAIYSFTGTVRATSLDHDVAVTAIEIEGWEEEADKILDWLARDVQQRFNLVDCRVYHAVGTFHLGEDMVYIVTASSHRKEGHDALMLAINRYKEEVPLWKKEYYEDGSSRWVSKKKWKRPDLG